LKSENLEFDLLSKTLLKIHKRQIRENQKSGAPVWRQMVGPMALMTAQMATQWHQWGPSGEGMAAPEPLNGEYSGPNWRPCVAKLIPKWLPKLTRWVPDLRTYFSNWVPKRRPEWIKR